MFKIDFWNHIPKQFRLEYYRTPCPCGCDQRQYPNLEKYLIVSLYFFGFTIFKMKGVK